MYVLLVDDEEDILEVISVTVQAVFSGRVLKASCGSEAVKIMETEGKPHFVISDLQMPNGDGTVVHAYLKKTWPDVPLVMCSGNFVEEVKTKVPDAYGYIEKPYVYGPLNDILGRVFAQKKRPEYVPLRLALLLRFGIVRYDLFLKLSESKYVKVSNAGDPFQAEDAAKFLKKNVDFLFIRADDAESFVKEFENIVSIYLSSDTLDDAELQAYSEQAVEAVVRLSKAIGINESVVRTAQKSVNLAIRAFSKNKDMYALLQRRLKNFDSAYVEHITTMSLLSCALCDALGWTSDFTQIKIAMASLVHDIDVPEKHYDSIETWNEWARAKVIKEEEVRLYKSHPVTAAQKLNEMKDLPPDIDQIVLQHHEEQNGDGFPNHINSSRISPLSALFIVTEDLSLFIQGKSDVKEAFEIFLKERADKYSQGAFRKVFLSLSIHFASLKEEKS